MGAFFVARAFTEVIKLKKGRWVGPKPLQLVSLEEETRTQTPPGEDHMRMQREKMPVFFIVVKYTENKVQ